MFQRILIFTLLIVRLSLSNLLAQDDIDQYFDDGKIGNAKNVFKINVISPIVGDLPIYFERVFSDKVTLEVGLGVLLPFYNGDIFEILDGEELEIQNPQFGFSIYVHPKFYWQSQSPELNYSGIQYRRRHYNLTDRAVVYNDISFNYGLQVLLVHRIAFDYNLGVGFRFRTVTYTSPSSMYGSNLDENTKMEIIGLVVPWTIRIGFVL